MILITIKFIFLTILIFLDFIIYLLPMYILGLIINLIITLIWYLPFIYQFYSFIFTTKEYNLRTKIYLLLFSPIIIILYIPFFITYFVVYGIFISLINPLITITQRPEYPIHSLSLIAAIVSLIYKYINGYPIEEILIDFLLSEKIKDIIDFTKQYWKYPEKFKQSTKSYLGELIFSLIIYISEFLDFFIIFPIFIMIIIPYIIVSVLILATYVTIDTSFDIGYNHNNKFRYILLIISTPFIFLFTLIITNSYGFYWEFKIIIGIFYKIFNFYKNSNNGFYDVINLFWVIIISPILIFEDFFYMYFKINLSYKQEFCEFYPW